METKKTIRAVWRTLFGEPFSLDLPWRVRIHLMVFGGGVGLLLGLASLP